MEFVKCRKCSVPIEAKIKWLPECWFLDTSNGCVIVKECDRHREWAAREFNRHRYEQRGFPTYAFYLNMPLDYVGDKTRKNAERLVSYAEKFTTNPEVAGCIIYLHGSRGTQKTTLASWVAGRLISKNVDVRYILMNDLVRALMDEDFDDAVGSRVADLRGCDLIIVDEAFDADKTRLWDSGKQHAAIETFFKSRRAQSLGTMFISNCGPADIEKQGFTESIADFVRRELAQYDSALQFSDKYEVSMVPRQLF